MSLKEFIKPMIDENVRLITTDKMLQKFMIGVFVLLTTIILYCKFFGDFRGTEYLFHVAEDMLSGEFSYSDLGINLPPLTVLLLIPPMIFSPTELVYCVLFSIYGFAFYMLGGHFMLKSCRETGFSEKDAYVLLFMFFACTLSFMTLSTGPIAPAFVIISLWFFHRKQYLLSFPALALATMSGFYPILLFAVFVTFLVIRGCVKDAVPGIIAYIVICAVFLFFPTWSGTAPYFDLPEFATYGTYLGDFYKWFDIKVHSNVIVLCSFILAGVFLVCSSIRLKHRPLGMYETALIFEIALVILLMLSPVYSPMYPIWIMMLFPMTQMTGKKYKGQKNTYLALAGFCVMTLVCDTLLTQTDSLYEISSLVRTAILAVFGICLARELKSLF